MGSLEEDRAVDGGERLVDAEGRPFADEAQLAGPGQGPSPIVLCVLPVGSTPSVLFDPMDGLRGVGPVTTPVVEVRGAASVRPGDAEAQQLVRDRPSAGPAVTVPEQVVVAALQPYGVVDERLKRDSKPSG